MSKVYGYAGAYDPELLQLQVERLEDADVPKPNIVNILFSSGDEENAWASVLDGAEKGDTIVIPSFPVLGADLRSAGEGAKKAREKGVNLRFLGPGSGPWGSQKNIEAAFSELDNEFSKSHIRRGRPRKPYPPGWRDVYKAYTDGSVGYKEACERLGIRDYDFFRMVQRYSKLKEGGEKK